MPKCRNCGARLSKLDKDICPVCGFKNPLEGVSSETVEITSQLNFDSEEFETYKPCTKVTTLALFASIGWTGAGLFYLSYFHLAIIWAAFNIAVLIGGVGSILAFLTPVGMLWGYLIMVIAAYVINLIVGVVLYLKPNMKDGRGEFLH